MEEEEKKKLKQLYKIKMFFSDSLMVIMLSFFVVMPFIVVGFVSSLFKSGIIS